mmetsp:Transcript_24820/g.69525  ORF Transcript_24820/g.69525 Transcript_24820/m.69525 type:complete len:158 (-) Transcript_24820:190-663(-)|eukprot:CAMPEP_0119123382 /NCGR_PEP_ID=MMETSP1310-20130426/3339_1 /TAXON_ID=464262 /ORGANISM="Genus nov. species nov., Strain RCC2339" /LENGTH=157 /DNA_ID=CAMNT_0007113177 /DNA_START=195 /DNA_END=671 /DNA_ORIENTATION=+
MARTKRKGGERGMGKKGKIRLPEGDDGMKAAETRDIDRLHEGHRFALASERGGGGDKVAGSTQRTVIAAPAGSSAGNDKDKYCNVCKTYFPSKALLAHHMGSKSHRKKANASGAKKTKAAGTDLINPFSGPLVLPSEEKVTAEDFDSLADSLASSTT